MQKLEKFAFIWDYVFYQQMILYAAAGGYFLFLFWQNSYGSWIWARWGGWHLVTVTQYLIVVIYIRYYYPKTFYGFVDSLTIPLLAGVIGESNFSYIYFIPWYRPWSIPAFQNTWWYGTWEFATLFFLAYAAGSLKFIQWKIILYCILAEVPVMYFWITTTGFRVSACVCAYKLKYWTDPTVNFWELVYYTVIFCFFIAAVKIPNELDTTKTS
jgi:hypothetical protein